MLRLSTRNLRISGISSRVNAFSSTVSDVDSVKDSADLVNQFLTEHQVTLKGTNTEKYSPFLVFSQTPFAPKIHTILKKEGFETPSPIQALSWPIALDGKDIISVAKTGSGKTLGFLLPGFHNILSQVKNTPKKQYGSRRTYKSPQVMVLAPTRELGNQIAAEATKYSNAGIDTVCVYGGASKNTQIANLRRGADCVVGTPGRAIDLIDEGAFDLSQIKYLVLDEADRMLDMGFEPQIRQIIDQLPNKVQGRQTLFFTATWPKEVQALAAEFLTDPVQVNIGGEDTLNANKDITQNVMIVKEFLKQDALLDLLEQRINPSDNPRALPKTIIFASTKATCDDLQLELRKAGYNAAALHGDKSQAARDDVMNSFRRGRINVLIATDIAARGLDVKDIEHVINYSFPNCTEDYVHRIGRTGRAGAMGTAYTFLNQKDMDNRRNMSDLVGVLTRCEQVVPPALEVFRRGGSKHSMDRNVSFRGRSPRQSDRQFGDRQQRGNRGDRQFGDRQQRGDRNGGRRFEKDAGFNGYGNGPRNYGNRERRGFGGDDEFEMFEERRGGNGDSNKFSGKPVRYEKFDFPADDYDDLHAARSSVRAMRK